MSDLPVRYDVGTNACSRNSTPASTVLHRSTRGASCPQPSLRVPATPANRAYLRRLRAWEAEAWEMGKDLRQNALRLLNGAAPR